MATPPWAARAGGGAWAGPGPGGRCQRAPALEVQARCAEAESPGAADPRPLNRYIPDGRARQYFLHCQHFSFYYGSFIIPVHHYHQSFCREINHNDNFGRHCKYIANNVSSHPFHGNAEARSLPSPNACATCSWGRQPTGSLLPHSRLCGPAVWPSPPPVKRGPRTCQRPMGN